MTIPTRRPVPDHQCLALPLWVRIWVYAKTHHGVPLAAGQLRSEVDPHATPKDVSRAIRRGVAAGLLTHDSSARAVYVVRGDQS